MSWAVNSNMLLTEIDNDSTSTVSRLASGAVYVEAVYRGSNVVCRAKDRGGAPALVGDRV